jgi:hypothetical protein
MRGGDAMHPLEVSDIYAANIPNCTSVSATTTDIASSIGSFCDLVTGVS